MKTIKAIQVFWVIAWPYLALTVSGVGSNVLTYHNDNQRTGLNPDEVGLTANSVNMAQFGKKFDLPVDGQVYAQPLYVSSVPINGSRHNLLIVVTENDSVYAFDADIGGAALWKKSLVTAGETPADSRNCGDLTPINGITSTPVIDLDLGAHGSVFVVAMTKTTSGKYIERLHSLDLTTGQDRLTPKAIAAAFPGTFPARDVVDGMVNWNVAQQRARAALLLTNKTIYTAWGSFCDEGFYAGWIIAYDESSLNQVSVLNDNPTANGKSANATNSGGSGGGIWGAGGALAADATNIFASTGNGPWDGIKTFGDSVLKLSSNNLQIVDFFTPFDQANAQNYDADLGSGGVVLLPTMKDAGGTARNLGVAAGKHFGSPFAIYVFDRSHLGKFHSANNSNLYQEVVPPNFQVVFSTPAYFNGALYYGAIGRPLERFAFSNARLGSSPTSSTKTPFTFPGTTPSVSAFSSKGIVWAIEMGSTTAGSAIAEVPAGGIHAPITVASSAVLHAYDASDLTRELYRSSSNSSLGIGVKFSVPTICNSKVYVGTASQVSAFGGIIPQTDRAAAVTLPAQVIITLGPMQYDSSTGHFVQTVTLKNNGTTSFAPPIPVSFVLDKLSFNASLRNSAGATTLPPANSPSGPIASPYINVPLTGSLAPGHSVSYRLIFIDPSDQAGKVGHITYTPRLLGGFGYR